jgi:VanZ family protein
MASLRPVDPRAAWLWAPVLVYAAAIFAASSVSEPPPVPGGVSDRAIHAWVYAGLALLVLRALTAGCWANVSARRAAAAALLASAYGLSDEWHQWFVPGRVFDLLDLLADTAGASAAVTLVFVIEQGRRRWRKPSGVTAGRARRPRSSHDDVPSADLT